MKLNKTTTKQDCIISDLTGDLAKAMNRICILEGKTAKLELKLDEQGRIQDLIRGGPDRDRPKTAILGPQFCRILVLGRHFWWSGGGPGPPPGSAPDEFQTNQIRQY